MKTAENVFIYIAIMALVTYLIRMLPLVIFRKKIENIFIRSFLYYIPYAVLAAMTFPAVLSSTGNGWSAVAGLIVALLLAFFEKGLLTVALSSCAAVFVIELLMKFIS
ncbi:MAG TPA: branched-chain amino acid transporter [Ruminococcaceae bacterium]|nr:branched-chain amino acid transporter [Oscillospiraceae bacterium]